MDLKRPGTQQQSRSRQVKNLTLADIDNPEIEKLKEALREQQQRYRELEMFKEEGEADLQYECEQRMAEQMQAMDELKKVCSDKARAVVE